MWWTQCIRCRKKYKSSTLFLAIPLCGNCVTKEDYKEYYLKVVNKNKQLQAELNKLHWMPIPTLRKDIKMLSKRSKHAQVRRNGTARMLKEKHRRRNLKSPANKIKQELKGN